MLGYVYNQVHCTPTSLLLLLKRAPPTVSSLPKFPSLISSDLTPTQSSGLSSNAPVLGKPSLTLLVEIIPLSGVAPDCPCILFLNTSCCHRLPL